MKQNQDLKKILQNAKLKNTTPRMSVLKAFRTVHKPLTAQELHKKLKKVRFDLVTLYRTLASFEEKGIVRRVDLRKDTVYYELNTDHHHHIICTKCEKVEDFENFEVEKTLEHIVRKSVNFRNVKSHALEIFGLCRECT
jgi:Fe2+ or Zn2+ uptake regulation protein